MRRLPSQPVEAVRRLHARLIRPRYNITALQAIGLHALNGRGWGICGGLLEAPIPARGAPPRGRRP